MSKNFIAVRRISKQFLPTANNRNEVEWDIDLVTGTDATNLDITSAIRDALNNSNFSPLDENFWMEYIRDNIQTISKWIKEKPDERIERLFHSPMKEELENLLKECDPELYLVMQVKKEGRQ